MLADRAADRSQKQLALMFLVHLVGDQHQPLHAADDGDRGGNQKQVHLHEGSRETRKNLHSLWDDMVMAEGWMEQSKLDPTRLASDLTDTVLRGASPTDVSGWTSGDFVTKATLESYEIAKTRIYPRYSQDMGRVQAQQYQAEMQPIARMRLAQAGVRLAALIESALGR